MNAPVTQWFAGNPVKVGVWETRSPREEAICTFQYWDGRDWHRCSSNPKEAYSLRKYDSYFQINEWRGLADKPKTESRS